MRSRKNTAAGEAQPERRENHPGQCLANGIDPARAVHRHVAEKFERQMGVAAPGAGQGAGRKGGQAGHQPADDFLAGFGQHDARKGAYGFHVHTPGAVPRIVVSSGRLAFCLRAVHTLKLCQNRGFPRQPATRGLPMHDHEHEHEEYDECCVEVTEATVGQEVVEFSMNVYDPVEGFFGEMSLAENKTADKWTILFFYPADFTFVCPTELADLATKHEHLPSLFKLAVQSIWGFTDCNQKFYFWMVRRNS